LLGPFTERDDAVVWSGMLALSEHPWLAEHEVLGSAVLAAASYLELAVTAASAVFGAGVALRLERFDFERPLAVPRDGAVELRVELRREESEALAFAVSTRSVLDAPAAHSHVDSAHWTLNARGRVCIDEQSEVNGEYSHEDGYESRETVQARCPIEVDAEQHYAWLARIGLGYSGAFRCIERLWRGENEVLALIHPGAPLWNDPGPTDGADGSSLIEPAVLDGALQALCAAIPGAMGGSARWLPIGVATLRTGVAAEGPLWAHAVVRTREASPGAPATVTGDVSLRSSDGRLVLTVEGVRVRELEPAALAAAIGNARGWYYETCFRPLAPTKPTAGVAAIEPGVVRGEGRWLCFVPAGATGTALLSCLREKGLDVVSVDVASGYAGEIERGFSLNPDAPQQWRRLLSDALDRGRVRCAGILHGWVLDAPTLTAVLSG